MIKRNQRILNGINIVSDGQVVFFASFSPRSSGWSYTPVIRSTWPMGSLRYEAGIAACIYAAAMMLILAPLGLYSPVWIKRLKYDIMIIAEASQIGVLGADALLYLFRLQDFPRCAGRILPDQYVDPVNHAISASTGSFEHADAWLQPEACDCRRYKQTSAAVVVNISKAPERGFQINGARRRLYCILC